MEDYKQLNFGLVLLYHKKVFIVIDLIYRIIKLFLQKSSFIRQKFANDTLVGLKQWSASLSSLYA